MLLLVQWQQWQDLESGCGSAILMSNEYVRLGTYLVVLWVPLSIVPRAITNPRLQHSTPQFLYLPTHSHNKHHDICYGCGHLFFLPTIIIIIIIPLIRGEGEQNPWQCKECQRQIWCRGSCSVLHKRGKWSLAEPLAVFFHSMILNLNYVDFDEALVDTSVKVTFGDRNLLLISLCGAQICLLLSLIWKASKVLVILSDLVHTDGLDIFRQVVPDSC